MMPPDRKRNNYLKLIEGLKAMIDERGAADVPAGEFRERLVCRECGARDPGPEARIRARSGSSQPVDGDRWVVIEAKKMDCVFQGRLARLETCSFICLSCGLWQVGVFKRSRD